LSPTSRLGRTLCFLALAAVTVVVLSPAPATAETSYKRLKRKLRNFEWHAGEALKGAGAISLAVMESVTWFPDLGNDEESEPSHHAHHATPPSPAPAHHEAPPTKPQKEKPEHKPDKPAHKP
jgi:hypothetical protein